MNIFRIGDEPLKGTLHLRQHSGLEWQFRWGDGVDPFPAGAELYLLVGPESASMRWDFDILAEYANLDITVTDAAEVADRDPFYFMFRPSPTAQPINLAQGRVKRWKVDR